MFKDYCMATANVPAGADDEVRVKGAPSRQCLAPGGT